MKAILIAMLVLLARSAIADPVEPVWSLVRQQRPAMVQTLKTLVELESGSRDLAGLSRLAAHLGERLAALGAAVEVYAPPATEVTRLFDTPDAMGGVVVARVQGTGSRRIMLLCHMDTVYAAGTLAKRPFRIEANRAYGPGIADAKGGIAVILHTLALLQAMDFRDFATLSVVINADEEISSPGSRTLIERMGAEHDVVLSFEPPLSKKDELALATSGIGMARLAVKGKAAHAGVNPELGRNAIIELAHRLLATNDLSDPARRIKFNWTLANGGQVRNMIPDQASATADVRVNRLSDLDVIATRYRERIAAQAALVPGTTVDADFEKRRAPLEATDASRALGRKAQAIYAELGRTLGVDDSGAGGGTDAAFAAVSGRPAVAESFGLIGFGFHSSDEEYVDLDSIEPRLYLAVRLIMTLAKEANDRK